MADVSFRQGQWEHRFDAHVEPINRLVDSLCQVGRGWMPYVAPMYGGVNARLVSLLRDPGPMTQTEGGSGFLSMENDDATAEAICNYFGEANITAEKVVPWNIFPWYVNRVPTTSEIDAGLEPLRALIELLPMLRVVMLHGGSAHQGWRRFLRKHGNLIAGRSIHVVATYHTSRQAFWHPDRAVREARRKRNCTAGKRGLSLISALSFTERPDPSGGSAAGHRYSDRRTGRRCCARRRRTG